MSADDMSIDDILGNIVKSQSDVGKLKMTYSGEIGGHIFQLFDKGDFRFKVKDFHTTARGTRLVLHDTENDQTYDLDIVPRHADND